MGIASWMCKKWGHKPTERFRRGLIKGTGYRTVAEEYVQRRVECRRCQEKFSDWENHKYITWYSGVQMSQSSWDEMRETGMQTDLSWWGGRVEIPEANAVVENGS